MDGVQGKYIVLTTVEEGVHSESNTIGVGVTLVRKSPESGGFLDCVEIKTPWSESTGDSKTSWRQFLHVCWHRQGLRQICFDDSSGSRTRSTSSSGVKTIYFTNIHEDISMRYFTMYIYQNLDDLPVWLNIVDYNVYNIEFHWSSYDVGHCADHIKILMPRESIDWTIHNIHLSPSLALNKDQNFITLNLVPTTSNLCSFDNYSLGSSHVLSIISF
jgi:hypothetical protein